MQLRSHSANPPSATELGSRNLKKRQQINCLSRLVSPEDMTISVLPDRMEQIIKEVSTWETRVVITKKEP